MGFLRTGAYVVIVTLLSAWGAQSASAFPHKVLTITPPQKDESKKTSPLQLELREAENGLEVSLRFADTPKKQAENFPAGQDGGNYLVFLDKVLVIGEPYKGISLNVSRDVPLMTLRNGKHTLRCELRTPSGEIHKGEIQFMFDGSPAINVTDVVVDKFGMLDPSVTINFLGDNKGMAGFIDVFLDERPVMNVPINKETTGKKMLLSQLAGKPISTASLTPGTHLLALRAIGINGNATVSYSPLTVQATPELKIIQDKNGDFQEAIGTLLKSPAGYSGSVEVFYNRGLLLFKRDEGASISIQRAEIIEALKKTNQEPSESSISLVFSLRAMNNTVNWQVVTVRP